MHLTILNWKPQKKQAPHIHAHNTQHTYTHYAHHDLTHSCMHARVYKCTHCGCEGHLVRFYYDRVNSINFGNKNVWVPNNASPHGPKKNGYQNSHLLYLM